jgi:hypothetical protein
LLARFWYNDGGNKELHVPDPSIHSESRNAIEKLVRSIPGFKGYFEREDRRESDHLARVWMVDQLQKCKSTLNRWQESLVDAGQLDALPAVDRLRSRIDLLQSRIKGAMRGYSGFFDYVKVKEAELDQVYQADLILMSDTTALVETCEQLATAGDKAQDVLTKLSGQVDELSRSFDKRNDILTGMNK